MPNFYAIQGKTLESLGDEESIRLFRSLVFAEAWRIRLPRAQISIPEKSSTADGGLDAKIDNSDNLKSEFLYPGLVGFQIKGYDLGPADCKKEIHQSEDVNKPLKPEVQALVSVGGTYVLVLFHELTEKSITSRKAALVDEFARLGYIGVRIEVWEASKIASYCDLFASVISEVNSDLLKSLPHSVWANQAQMKEPEKYYADDIRKQKSEEIRNAIAKRSAALFFRMDGLPGIGKTRFVCETLKDSALAPATVYMYAENFMHSVLWHNLQKKESTSGIFVIDECSISQHNEIVSTFGAAGDRLVFITMSYQAGRISPPTNKFSLDALPDELMKKILEDNFPSLPFEVRHRLVGFSDGFPRIALLLGKSYAYAPSKQTGRIILEDTELLNRLLCGRPELSDGDKKTKRALSAVALFEKIGFVDPVDYEAKWLADNFDLSWNEFRDIIHDQRERGIVQGEHYLYITPAVLKIHLIEYWWESRGLSFAEFNKFVISIPTEYRHDLFSRFTEHFKYLDSSHRGKGFVAKLLDIDNGLFSDVKSLKEKLTADFFLILTEVNPNAALKVLEKHIGILSKEELLGLKETRRQILRALEKIAVWEPMFTPAAQLMLQLAQAENETWSNNSTGILKDLFGMGTGSLASTEASPTIRLSFIQKIIQSEDPEIRRIALLCLSEFIDNGGGHRTIGPEYQGTKTVAQLWKPKTYGDLFSAWKNGWDLLRSVLNSHGPQAAEIAIKRARGMIGIDDLSETVLRALEAVPTSDGAIFKQLMLAIQVILKYEGKSLKPEIRDRLVSIQAAPFGSDKILADLRKYVGVHSFSDPDTLNREDGQKRRDGKIALLAEHFQGKTEELVKHLDWIFGAEAENAWEFGRALGKIDRNRKILGIFQEYLENHLQSVNPSIIGGYVKAVRDSSPEEADNYLEKLARSPAYRFLIDVAFRSGASDNFIDLLLKMDSQYKMQAKWFGGLAFGGTLSNISSEKTNLLIEHLLAKPDPEAAGICANILEFYYKKEDPKFPIELARKVLMDERFTNPPEGYSTDTMTEYYWNEIAKKLFKVAPQYRLEVALKLIEHFGADGSVTDGVSPMASHFINQAISENPKELWDKVSPNILDTHTSVSFWLREWLRKVINYFSKEVILDWISADPSVRAPAVADIVPREFAYGSGSLARSLIEKYGSDEHVRSALGSSIIRGVWTGPRSRYYAEIAEYYSDLAKNEPQSEIRAWFIEMGVYAEKSAQQERLLEEKRGF